MSGIVTGMLYLASPLATPAGASTADVNASSQPAFLAGSAVEIDFTGARAAVSESAAAPAIDWAGKIRAVRDAIADDVQAMEASSPPLSFDGQYGAVGPAVDTAPEPAGVDDAVLAEHDARIAFLKHRIGGKLADGTLAPKQMADLRARLHRAEAARKLAMARVAQARSSVNSPATQVAALGEAYLQSSVARVIEAATPSEPARGSVSATWANDPAARTKRPGGERLRHARGLLASARAALRADPAPARVIEIAGLWHWEGSRTWSLSNLPRAFA